MKAFCHAAFLISLCAANAYADDYVVDSPQVSEGEVSAEANLNYSKDNQKNLDRYMSQVYGVSYGVTSFWATEILAEVEKSSASSTQLNTVRWENFLVPFKPGTYWLDTGLRIELDKSVQENTPNNVETTLLLEKRFGDFINTANISFDHNFGPHYVSGIDYGVSWRTKYHVNDMFEPGFEYYSDIGKLNRDDEFNKQNNVLGPVIQGSFGEINYDTGVLFGISQSAPDVTFKFNLEYTF